MPKTPKFEPIYALAVKHKGSEAEVERLLPEVASPRKLARIRDDRWLAAMTKRIFQSGFNWQVVETKWTGFEEAFDGFDPNRWANASDDELSDLTKNPAIIRNGAKIMSVRGNAILLTELAAEHGAAAKAFAKWPATDFVGLLRMVHKRGSRLGGATAQYLFRGMGVDSFILSHDVGVALVREGIVDKPPTSKGAMDAVQAAFNDWMEATGRPLTHLSRILAMSVPTEHPGPERTSL